MKQKQNRPTKRMPHGSPLHTKQFGFWCTEEMHAGIMKAGGSEWARKVLEKELNKRKE